MKKLGLLLSLMAVIGLQASAADSRVLLYGYVVEGDYATALDEKKPTDKTLPLTDVDVVILVNGEQMKAVVNRQTGFYSLVLPAGVDYRIRFSKAGYLPKNFDIRASEIPEKEFDEAFKLFTDVTLFPETDTATADLVKNIVTARCHFDVKRERLSWDLAHAVDSFERFMSLADPERMALRLGN